LIPDKLKFKTNYNVFVLALRTRNLDKPYLVDENTWVRYSSLEAERQTNINQYWDNTLTYEQSFGKHDLSFMVGTSYRDEAYNKLHGYVNGVPLDENNLYINPDLVTQTVWVKEGDKMVQKSLYEVSKDVSETGTRFYGLSYFGRISYNFDNKYIAYFTFRRDGSHSYQDKWGNFPAFGLAWVVSEESFFKVNFIDYLKLRGGWGKLGRDNGATSSGSNTVTNVLLPINDQEVSGTYSTSTYSVLGWEVVEESNVGLTAELFRNRLNLEADYFIRNTQNAIIPVSLLLQAGTIYKNAGGIRNSGFELALRWNDKISSDLSYSIGVNLSTLKNEVTDLYGQQFLNYGTAEFQQRSQVGQPIFSFYGYQTAGVYQNQAEIDADPVAVANSLVPGDFKFKDQNSDGIIDDDDKVFLGSYLPKFTYGGSLGLDYKGLSFSLTFMGQNGNKILNRKRGNIIWTNDMNQDAELLTNLWNGEGTSNKYPSASGLRRGWNQNFSDYLVEDGSFFRIQNIQLAYTFKQDQYFKGMPQTRIYFTAEKPLTLFKYNGFNPEVPDGIDAQYYPIPAVYTIGLNLKL